MAYERKSFILHGAARQAALIIETKNGILRHSAGDEYELLVFCGGERIKVHDGMRVNFGAQNIDGAVLEKDGVVFMTTSDELAKKASISAPKKENTEIKPKEVKEEVAHIKPKVPEPIAKKSKTKPKCPIAMRSDPTNIFKKRFPDSDWSIIRYPNGAVYFAKGEIYKNGQKIAYATCIPAVPGVWHKGMERMGNWWLHHTPVK